MNKHININRTLPDTSDNVQYRDYYAPIDYRGIAILVGTIITILTVIWLIVLLGVKVDCWLQSNAECKTAAYVFWGYLGIYGAALLIALLSAIPFIYQRVKNSEYLAFRGIKAHRDDIRSHTQAVLQIAQTSAASEASAGIDTYSPSISYNSTSKNNGSDVVDTDMVFSDEVPIEAWEK